LDYVFFTFFPRGDKLHEKGRSFMDFKNGSIDALDEKEIKRCLSPELKDMKIIIYDETDSTNTRAKEMKKSAVAGDVLFVANAQSGGRGRRGKSFFSPKDKGLYMSVLMNDAIGDDQAQLLTVMSAVAVCEAIESLADEKPQIKWVNDVYIGDKKVCGILSEAISGAPDEQTRSFVVGIGVNCSLEESDMPEELRGKIASLKPGSMRRNQLCVAILNALYKWRKGDKKSLIFEYKRRSFLMGKEISYSRGEKTHAATAVDINGAGNLIVRGADGKEEVLSSGEVDLLGW